MLGKRNSKSQGYITASKIKPKKSKATSTMSDDNHSQKGASSKLPVTLLGGFLGSGKTTLLKHILENKHNLTSDNKPFNCAVIVNDVAELNIDKALIDSSSFVQKEEVIAMQNGCVCCTLKSDLVDQIKTMALGGKFDYMIIEASGISEPSEIAAMFAECAEDHDHEAEHEENALFDLARLDTCVTVVDSSEFFASLDSIALNDKGSETYSKLLVEQIEYSNVVVVNKTDLVSEAQIEKITDHVMLLNPNAKILTSKHSTIDVKQVVDTKLYNAKDFEGFASKTVEIEEVKQCCKSSMAKGESACCKRARTFDSGMSQVILTSKKIKQTRHAARFGIHSFLYKARRPFHPVRLQTDFMEKFFMSVAPEEDEGECEHEVEIEEGEEGVKSMAAEDEDEEEEIDPAESLRLQQEEAKNRGILRSETFGSLLRTKGFIWSTFSHDFMTTVGQAGNVVNMEIEAPWKVLDPQAWSGSEKEKESFRRNNNFGDTNFAFGDRRQELVFIGQELKHNSIQKVLDSCLLTDEEFAMGVDGWKTLGGDMFLDH